MEEQTRIASGVYERRLRGPRVKGPGSRTGRLAGDVACHKAEAMPYGGPHHGPEAVFENVRAPVIEDVPTSR